MIIYDHNQQLTVNNSGFLRRAAHEAWEGKTVCRIFCLWGPWSVAHVVICNKVRFHLVYQHFHGGFTVNVSVRMPKWLSMLTTWVCPKTTCSLAYFSCSRLTSGGSRGLSFFSLCPYFVQISDNPKLQ